MLFSSSQMGGATALLFPVAEFGYFYLIPRGWRHSPFLLPYREGVISVFLHLLLGGGGGVQIPCFFNLSGVDGGLLGSSVVFFCPEGAPFPWVSLLYRGEHSLRVVHIVILPRGGAISLLFSFFTEGGGSRGSQYTDVSPPPLFSFDTSLRCFLLFLHFSLIPPSTGVGTQFRVAALYNPKLGNSLTSELS